MAITKSTLFSILVLSLFASFIRSEQTEAKEFVVLTLDHTNFTETMNTNVFIVVHFYDSRSEYSKELAYEQYLQYEEVASKLSRHVPPVPVVLTKIDASDKTNREFVALYGNITSFPTTKTFKYGVVRRSFFGDYIIADAYFFYLKKLSKEPLPSLEIKSVDDAAEVIGDKEVVVVGVFPKLSGSEYNSFLATAHKFRCNYNFAHTLDAKLLPRGESTVIGPVVRLFNPSENLVVDSKDFDGEALERFVKESNYPLITIFNKDPNNYPHIINFFESIDTKVMLFINFTGEAVEPIKSKYREVATSNKRQGLSFLLGDVEMSQGAVEFYGLEESQVPLIIIQTPDNKKYLKTNVEFDQIESWFKDFTDGKVALYKRSQPIPTENNEPVKVVVSQNLDDKVFKSGKNVLLEFYNPRCEHCPNLDSELEIVAESFQSDPSVVIATIDATANEFPTDTFDLKGFPTIYFISASGTILVYEGDWTESDIISFIDKNKDTVGEPKKVEKTNEEANDEL